MTVEPLVPDLPPASVAPHAPPSPDAFGEALDALGAVLGAAQHAEDAFARGAGSLNDAVYRRAQADVALSVATAAAQRTVQALQSILNMQV